MESIRVVIISMFFLTGSLLFLKDDIQTSASNDLPNRSAPMTVDMNISDASLSSFIGEAASDRSGYSVSGAGDVNGDGYDDILIGACRNAAGGNAAGQTYLILGKSSGWSMDTSLGSADASFIGEASGDESGYSVSGAGDVNGDGYDDILIGAHHNKAGGNDAGQTYLILGKSSGWSMDTSLGSADASFIGEADFDESGGSVSGAGDVNGDGYDDILIGADGNDAGGNDAGQTYLILGKSSGWSMDKYLISADRSFIGEANFDRSGYSVSGAGDVNGDGYDDILIGAYHNNAGGNNAGQTYLILGKCSGWSMEMSLGSADSSFIGEADDDLSGCSVSGAGDVNGDGYDDILIGARYNAEGGICAGQTYLILGKASGWFMDTSLGSADASFIGEAASDYSGTVSGAGDVDGDGYDDIMIGAYAKDAGRNNAGQTYLMFGKGSGWSMDTSLDSADASFIGEAVGDGSGWTVSAAGDANGDGYDDIMIGALLNDAGGNDAGQTYLISGIRYTEPLAVYSVDLYSDIVFSTPATVADIGETIFVELKGLDSNASNMDIAVVNVTSRPGSFGLIRTICVETGLSTGIFRGTFKVPIGTLYLDTLKFYSRKDTTKFDMVFIDHPFRPTSIYSLNTYFDDQYSIEVDKVELGETIYIEVTGQDSNSISRNLALVNISTEYSIPVPYPLVLQETDINTGRYRTEFKVPENFIWLENIRLTSCRDQNFFDDIKLDIPFRPTSIDSLKVCSDSSYSKEIDKIQWNEIIYIEVVGQSASNPKRGRALINITSDETLQVPIVLPIHETGINTGVYRGEFTVPTSTKMLENLTISSAEDPSKSAKVMVCILVEIGPGEPIRTINEDEKYCVRYSNLGYADDPTWTYQIECDWLTFDMDTLVLSGTPDNEDVGVVSVTLNLSDDVGHHDVQEFNLSVNNTSPILIGTDISDIDQGEYYEMDYNSTDDGQGHITFYLTTPAGWLEMNPNSGVLFGKPENDDVGVIIVTVSVNDGNEGWDSRQFNLTVNNINDPPRIISDDITTVDQGDPIVRNYQAEEIDVDDEIRWELNTDADFLSIDEDTGRLSGTPTYLDVGIFYVNVSVWDLSDAFDFHNFTLTVKNINDPPIWTDFPSNLQVVHGRRYTFDVNATDHDGDKLRFSISSTPASDISIDEYTGLINWTADIHMFLKEPYRLEVKVSAFDGLVHANRTFTITVLASEPPSVELLGPTSGIRTPSAGTILRWEGTDPEDEPITYDIYVHQTEAFVLGLREEALYEPDHVGDNITVTGLEPGKTYFWTVIPNDGCSYGECDTGVLSFRVNYKPTFKAIEDQKVHAGADFKYKISCTDQDTEDLSNLRYSLKEAPEGMTISEETGMIRWTPKDNQVMLHSVVVEVSDGIETNTATFRIEVGEGESSTSTLLITIGIVVVVVILLALGIFLLLRKKKQMDEAALKRGEEERAALEKEREGEYLSYEQLYGVPAPEKEDEELTTRELKEYIHERIEELEE